MALGVQYSGIWTMAQQFQAVGAGTWKGLPLGYMWLWGSNSYGQIGDNTVINRSSPVQIGDLSTWSKIAVKASHTMALKTDGTMWLWGPNGYGQVGDNTVTVRSSPVQIGTLTTWSQIAAGTYHSVAVKTNGTLWTFGYHNYGNLGDNTTIPKSSPVQVGALTTWSQIASGVNHNLAIKTDGTLWAWGRNSTISGALGDNSTINRSSPVQIGALTTWSKISGGSYHSIALQTDGTLWTFGYSYAGNLGGNTADVTGSRSSPVQVGAEIFTWSTADGASADRMGIRTDGSLWLWGAEGYGKIGDNAVIKRSSPVQIGSLTTWSKVAGRTDHSLAIKTDGSLWAWGSNANNGGRGFGSLGDNTSINRSSPVQVGALTTWSKIAASFSHSMAIKTDGTMWAWGRNDAGDFIGVLGDNTTISRSSPVQVGALTTWSLVSCGRYHTLAVKTDGTMWSWGRNSGGPLGLNTPYTTQPSSPTQIGSDSNWSKISGAGYHSMAIKTDGTLWLWGSNAYGRLGTNNVIARSSPVQVGALTSWSKISGGNDHSLALKNDGTMWAWGTNDNKGQLGDNTTVHKSSPIQVGILNTWAQVIGGDQGNSYAIETDGSWYSWGRGYTGELGDNTIVYKSSPVQIGSDPQAASTWSKISTGYYHNMAIKPNGTLWSFGYNNYGNLGDGTTISKSSPIQVGALTSWSLIAAGSYHNLAIKTDGTLWVWGRNDNGMLGDNTVVGKSSPIQVGTLTTWSQIAAGVTSMAFGGVS